MTIRKRLPILLSFSLIAAALFLVVLLEPQPTPLQPEKIRKQPVTITKPIPQPYQPNLSLLGTTQARWPVELKSPTTARLVWLDEKAEPGTLINKGDVLAKIDTTHLQSQVAETRSTLQLAKLNLLQQQHEQTVALRMLSKENSSEFARREPQIASAKADLRQAKESLDSAQQYLRDATITAPFDAIILRRDVSPSQQLDVGDPLFTLASSDSLDIAVPVPEHHWKTITSALESPIITVTDKQGQTWSAAVRYVAPQADNSSRQRQVILSVNHPYSDRLRLLPNQQVEVKVALNKHESVVQVPLSAITRDGKIWTVNSSNALQMEPIEVINETSDHAYVSFEQQPQKPRAVVSYPLLSMIDGVEVSPEYHAQEHNSDGQERALALRPKTNEFSAITTKEGK
ncbi:efflux RND transporter periplasmic adaptor subunit [uncultured Vibrio sp.]|uniref:efflux RND transporter periplasmic adaptor subunit n=1 Tax=uncultured Vibrio sp. TaxID=114054 RepID=UPI0025D6697B|nr:efflux RND transporter periplasmic adaptor subunit [uncultured Vibrio sp.]